MKVSGNRLALIRASHPTCVRCGAEIFPTDSTTSKATRKKLVIHHGTNAVGDEIAWCDCPKCGKVTPLKFP